MLALSERGRRETTREEIVELLGAGPKAADHAIESLRRKGWLEWAAGGSISSYAGRARAGLPPDSNLIALPRRIATRYYIGFGRAVVHYGVITQHTDRSDLGRPSSPSDGHLLVRFALLARTYLDSHFSVKSPEEIEQLVCREPAEVSVHQVGYVGLCNAENSGHFALLQFLLFQDFEDVKSYLRTSHQLIGIFQSKIGKNIPGADLGLS